MSAFTIGDLGARSAIEAAEARLDALEDADAALDAADVAYTPNAGGDWDDPDPTTVEGALDDLAERTKALEDADAALDASGIDYTPGTGGDWIDPDPSKVDGALDDLAGRAKALEDVATLVLTPVAGAETDNAIEVTITCTDNAGAAVASALVLVELLDADLDDADGSQQAFDATTGTAISADLFGSNVHQLVQADAGTIVLSVADKSTALAASMYLRLTPVDRTGPKKLFAITFA